MRLSEPPPSVTMEPEMRARAEKAAEQRRITNEACTVAELVKDGRRIRKVHQSYDPCRCGSPRWAYINDLDETLQASSMCDACLYREAIRGLPLRRIYEDWEIARDERRRFAEAYPGLASDAPLPGPPARKVELGEVSVPIQLPVRDIVWRAVLERHGDGDFGEFGKLGSAKVTAEARKCQELFDRATFNAVVLERRHGVIRSRFPYPKEYADSLTDSARHLGVTLDVATLFPGRGQPTTVCLLTPMGQQCFGAT